MCGVRVDPTALNHYFLLTSTRITSHTKHLRVFPRDALSRSGDVKKATLNQIVQQHLHLQLFNVNRLVILVDDEWRTHLVERGARVTACIVVVRWVDEEAWHCRSRHCLAKKKYS